MNTQQKANEQARIPTSYRAAQLRGVLPVDDVHQITACSFDLPDGSIVRLSFSVKDAADLAHSILNYLSDHLDRVQSPKSSDISSSPRSIPDEGMNVCPPEISSDAC